MNSLGKIEHFVVLMLENRSFDNLLGQLYPKSADFDGLSGAEMNLDAAGVAWKVNNQGGLEGAEMQAPDPDPGEHFDDINTQLFGSADPPPGAAPDMGGFVANYMAQAADHPGPFDPAAIMHHFTPGQVPVISALARLFAVSDRWFASAPCQTWPNRFFVHAATAHGYENNAPPNFPYFVPSIYERIDAAGLDGGWKVYFHDIAQALTLERLHVRLDRFRLFAEFLVDARQGSLPAYSFIEPRYFADLLQMPNDQHPPHNVALGEQLLASVYNALRNGPDWAKTMLVVTYDEHGGCYDHVAPPAAARPEDPRPGQRFDFGRYGARVPAVLISPYVKPGTILRPAGATPFDHTSIIATLRKRFPELGAALTRRDAAAPDFGDALSLDSPDNLGPQRLDALPYHAPAAETALASAAKPNAMQQALLDLAAHVTKGKDLPVLDTFLSRQIAAMPKTVHGVPVELANDVSSAVAFVKNQLARLFQNV